MLTIQQIADEAGLSPKTIRYYNKTGNRARREGVATERDFPAPVGIVDGANVWDESEIRAWLEVRKQPARRGAIAKAEMRNVLSALERGNVDQAITIARKALS